MMPVLRCSKAHRKIPKPNLAFIRHYVENDQKDPQAVASHVLQSNRAQLSTKEDKLDYSPCEAVTQIKEFPEQPTTCCMSGCANCVWLDYAEKLSEYYRDGGEKALKEINENISDTNLRAFLLMELQCKKGT